MDNKKVKKIAALLLAVLLFPGGLSFAATTEGRAEGPSADIGAPQFAAPSPALPQSAEGQSVKGQRTAEGNYILDFKSASLINVLKVLSSLSGISFVAGAEVADRQVNMTLENVGLEDVLQSIAHGCNVSYDFLPGRNIYLFRASADSADQPALVTRVFKLYYVRVTKIREIESTSTTSSSGSSGSSSGDSGSSGGSTGGGLVTLKAEDETKNLEGAAVYKAVEKMLSARGKVSVDDRSNSLIVTDSEDRVQMVAEALAQLDRPLDQVLINVLLVETFEDLDRNLGVEWGNATTGAFGTVTGGTENTSFPFFTKPGSSSDVGNWFTQLRNQFDPTANTNPGVGPNVSSATSGIRNFNDFRIQVRALENASKLRILAKPKILVLDNHPALIKIATDQVIGNITTTASAGGPGTITSSPERTETGTILRVTPLINTDDRITLTVEPTFATVDQSAITLSAVSETGDPTVRTARTTLMVNSGQTIAIGGLLLSNQSNGNRKVPFFGNIPLIGKAFFTSNTKSLQDRELILFLSPLIIRDPSELETPTVPDKRLRFRDETAPFYKVKQKEWYKRMDEGEEPPIDFDGYFDVRKRLMEATLDTLGSKAETGRSVPARAQKK